MSPAPTRRSALPTLLLTLIALLAVLATLVLTGRHHKPAEFGLMLDTPVVTVTAGGTITTTVTVHAQRNFSGLVTLSTSNLPDGLVAEFEPPTVTVSAAAPTATATLRLRTTHALPSGAIGVGVVATAGNVTQTSLVQLEVQSDGSLTTAPATVPALSPVGFVLSGDPVGALAPGTRLPIDVHLDNPGDSALSVASILVTMADTSRPGCGRLNFALTQYTGRYPLQLPARSHNSLSALGVARSQWPTLTMLNLPVNQDACKGVSVHLRFSGSGAGT